MTRVNKEETQKRFNSIIYFVVLIVVGIGAFLALGLMFGMNNKTPVGTIQLVSTPSITMVINDKDRVIGVVYDNFEGEALLSNTSLEGKTVKEACQIFAKLCCKAGYIDATELSSGQSMLAMVANVSNAKVLSVQEKVVSAINGFFDENGIIAGVVCNPKELNDYAESYDVDLSTFILAQTAVRLGSRNTQDELVAMTKFQLLNHIKSLALDLKGLSYECYTDYISACEAGLADFKTYLEELIVPTYAEVSELNFELKLSMSVEEIVAQVNEFDLEDDVKTALVETINNNTTLINEKLAEINQKLAEIKSELLDASSNDFDTAKSVFKKKIDSYATSYQQGRDYYKNNKSEIQNKITEYRNSLTEGSLSI